MAHLWLWGSACYCETRKSYTCPRPHHKYFSLVGIKLQLVSWHLGIDIRKAGFYVYHSTIGCSLAHRWYSHVQLSIIGIPMKVEAVAANEMSQRQNVDEKQQGSKDRSLGHTPLKQNIPWQSITTLCDRPVKYEPKRICWKSDRSFIEAALRLITRIYLMPNTNHYCPNWRAN